MRHIGSLLTAGLWGSQVAFKASDNLHSNSKTSQLPKFSDAILSPSVDAFIERALSEFGSSAGVAIAVVRHNGRCVEPGTASGCQWNVETRGYGNATAAGTKVNADTLFSIASNTKLFNVLSVGKMISNGSLEFSDKISSLIPEWGLSEPFGTAQSSIFDLMSHRTGVPRHEYAYSATDNDVPSLIKRIRHLKPSAEFRDAWQYNNLMYITLSHLPQALLGIPFTTYVKNNLFEPLGLNATTFSFQVADRTGNLADGFAREGIESGDLFRSGRTRVLPFMFQEGGEDGGTVNSGAGGIITSVKDMAVWLQMLLLGGRHPVTNETIVEEKILDTVSSGITVQAGVGSKEMSPVVYGGGQQRSSYRGHLMIEHGGAIPGFMSQITRFPIDGLGIAVLCNDDAYGTNIHTALRSYLADVALGLPPIDWIERQKEVVRTASQEKPKPTPRPRAPSSPSASGGFDALSGTYVNPGYGVFELCYFPPSDVSFKVEYASDSCDRLRKDANVTIPGTVKGSVPTFVIKWDKLWASHAVLEHFDGDVFNVTMYLSRSTGDPEQPFWAYSEPLSAYATFDEEGSGFGMGGDFWGKGKSVDVEYMKKGKTLKDRSEVWFDRV